MTVPTEKIREDRRRRQASGCLRHAATWTAAVAMALMAAAAVAQPRGGLSPEADAIFSRWVATTCTGDEERKLIEEMRRHAAPLAAAFRRAIVAGPPPEQLRAARAAAEARFAAGEKISIQDFRIEGVSEKDLDVFRRVSRESYVDDQVRRFATGYRSNAVAGLAIVGGPGARDLLKRIAGNADDPLALAAREALRTMGPR
jgi:hypothetical protein